jgi:hypothetical protein
MADTDGLWINLGFKANFAALACPGYAHLGLR